MGSLADVETLTAKLFSGDWSGNVIALHALHAHVLGIAESPAWLVSCTASIVIRRTLFLSDSLLMHVHVYLFQLLSM